MVNKKTQATSGSARVTLISEDVIECVLEGDITGPIVKRSMQETKDAVDAVRGRGLKPKLLIEMSKVTSQDSEARSRSKALATYGFNKIAICGADHTLKTIGEYIIRIAGMQEYARFIRSRRKALLWLRQSKTKQRTSRQRAIGLSAIIIALIGIGILIGWSTETSALVALLPNTKATNPVTALNFTLLSLAILLLVLKSRLRMVKYAVGFIIGWLFIYSLSLLMYYALGVPTSVDTWLFTERLANIGIDTTRASPATSMLFALSSLMMFLVLIKLKNKWRAVLFRLFSLVACLVILFVFIGYAYGLPPLYTWDGVPISVYSLLAFLIAAVSIISTVYSPEAFPHTHRFLRRYGRGLLVFGSIALLTGLSWQRANTIVTETKNFHARQVFDNAQTAAQTRINTYTNAMQGFKAFFEGSNVVSATEYQRYFNSLALDKNYPGFSAVSFIRAVPPTARQDYEAFMRSQMNEFPNLRTFSLPPNNGQALYALTYTQPTTEASYGTDISQLPGRLSMFETARDTGKITMGRASFTGTNGNQEAGFVLTIPVYNTASEPISTQDRRKEIYGFINATFRNNTIFGEIFKSSTQEKEVIFRIEDAAANTVIYETDALSARHYKTSGLSQSVQVGNYTLNLTMDTIDGFRVDRATRSTPRVILMSGLTVAVLSGIVVVSLLRRREEALALASSMTEDLNNERAQAETLRKKDEAILASIGDAVFAIDTSGHIALFNPAAERISGFSQTEALGKPYKDILHFIDEQERASYDFIDRALKGRVTSMKFNTRLIRKNGTVIDVADSAAPIYDAKKDMQGAIVVFRDVSNERALEQAKSEFVSLASHQLRTPLSAINWYAEMLLNEDAGKLSTGQREYMNEIYEGNRRMIELVDSLLNVSRLEVGRLKNDPQPIAIADITNSLEKELRANITAKKLAFIRQASPKLPVVNADPKLIRMIMQNLLSNAIKYTPDNGTVTLTVRQATAAEIAKAKVSKNKKYLYISVNDTGYGIPKPQQEKIFEKLFRADNVRKMDVEGTGLGLYIVKEVTKKLGGTIWFESIESVGSTFYVVIPM